MGAAVLRTSPRHAIGAVEANHAAVAGQSAAVPHSS
jgi:hypothetical protein